MPPKKAGQLARTRSSDSPQDRSVRVLSGLSQNRRSDPGQYLSGQCLYPPPLWRTDRGVSLDTLASPGLSGSLVVEKRYEHWAMVCSEESDLCAVSLPMLGARRPGLREVGTVGMSVLGQTRS